MFLRRPLVGLALIGLVSGAGCSSSNAVPVRTTAQFVISVPQNTTSTSSRGRNFQAPSGTQSVSFLITSFNGTPATGESAVTFKTTATAPGCALSGAVLLCTETVAAIAGSDIFTVTAFDGNGNTLAEGQVQVNAARGTTTAAPIALSGTVASIAVLLPSSPIGVLGGPSVTIPVSVIAKDSTGATIMGTYNNPITVTDSDTSGNTTLSATTIGDSSTSVTLAYNGRAIAPAGISATAANVAPSAVTGATFTPNADVTTSNGATYGYNESTNLVVTMAGATPAPAQTSTSSYTSTFTTGATFNNLSNLIQVHQVFVYPGDTTNYAQDDYLDWSPTASGASLYEVGSHFLEVNAGTTLVDQNTVMAGHGRLMADVPFASGNAWDTSVTYTSASSGSYGSDNATYNADGSYNDTSGGITTMVNADGSATQTSDAGTTSVGAPVANNGRYVIPVTPAGSTTATMVPDWYPGSAAAPSPLMSDKISDKGLVAISPQCDVPASPATQAELLEEKLTQLDPINAMNTTATSDTYYVSGFGVVCTVVATEVDYYDLPSGQLTEHDDFGYVDSLASSSLPGLVRTIRSKNSAASEASSIGPAALQTFASRFHARVAQFKATAARRHRMVR